MKRKFKPPRPAGAPAAAQPAQAAPGAGAPPQPAVFDCLFWPQCKKRAGSVDGTLVVQGSRAQLFDLQLREKASALLPTATAAALHAAHEAAVAAVLAGQPLGPLWSQQEAPERLKVGQFEVSIEDERGAAVQQVEWELRQRVGAEAKAGRPKDAVGPQIPANSIGARMLAGMGWQPGQGVGRQPSSGQLVVPQLKWDKAGLGSNASIKRLGAAGAPKFRRATATAAGCKEQPAPGSAEV